MFTDFRALALLLVAPASGRAQDSVTREQVIAAALAHGSRSAFARTDSATAVGAFRAARAYPNPILTATYSKDTPRYHAITEFPIDLSHQARAASARASLDAATARYGFERAAVRFEADTLYTRALGAAAHARLSHRTARDADSLRALAVLRRDVGDASELDVQLATVNAGQADNAAITDSLTALAGVLEVQRVMGLPSSSSILTLADTLTLVDSAALDTNARMTDGHGISAASPGAGGTPALVAAAQADYQSADRAVAVARASAFGTPAIQVGVEWYDPSPNGERGALPLVAAALPLPLFNRGRGDVEIAIAARDRARAALDVARRESDAAIAAVTRERDVARTRARRDETLLDAADRVAAMALTAFAEGAVALPNVLDAQRSAREAQAQYVDDVAAADNAAAALRLLSTSSGAP